MEIRDIVANSYTVFASLGYKVAEVEAKLLVFIYDLRFVQQLDLTKIPDDAEGVQFLKDYADIILATARWPLYPEEVDISYTDVAILKNLSDVIDAGIALFSRIKA